MPKQTKTCRVCGATYEACNSARSGNRAFNWREVACSPECGMVYLNRITDSRRVVDPAEDVAVIRSNRKKKVERHEPKHEQSVEAEIISAEMDAVMSEGDKSTE